MQEKNVTWKGYYLYNSDVLIMIENLREASPMCKERLLNDLIKKLTYMVQARIKCYKKQSFYPDLLQEGRLALIKAIEDFDSHRGINFFKFASWHIRSRINNYLRWWKRTCESKDHKILQEDDVLTPHESFEKEEKKIILINAIGKLPKIDREVVMMRYGVNGYKNHTLKQIGDVFSLSKQRIQQIESRALAKLIKNRNIKDIIGVD